MSFETLHFIRPLWLLALPLAVLLSLERVDRRDDPSPTGRLDKTMTAAATMPGVVSGSRTRVSW